jgi:hypothetical protein
MQFGIQCIKRGAAQQQSQHHSPPSSLSRISFIQHSPAYEETLFYRKQLCSTVAEVERIPTIINKEVGVSFLQLFPIALGPAVNLKLKAELQGLDVV